MGGWAVLHEIRSEYAQIMTCIYLLAAGPGPWSLDALLQRRGGTARHDAVVWGYARAADRLGVDIVQNCEVTGVVVKDGRTSGIETSRGTIRARCNNRPVERQPQPDRSLGRESSCEY